jgi:hypothetical protein
MSDILCDCGANNDADARTCWLCDRQLQPSEQRAPASGAGSGPRFTLSWLMLLVTLIAVGLGVEMQIQGLGVALGVLSLPAMIRTTSIARRRGARGRALSTVDRVEIFFVSLIIVVLILLAFCVAFCATCLPMGLLSMGVIRDSEGAIFLAFGTGLVAAIAVSIFIARRLWPDQRSTSNPPRPPASPPPPPHDDNS